ncbi:hypothetical protein Tco_1236318 [Tanacetum coccineum]
MMVNDDQNFVRDWEFGKFTSRDGESLESYYSRFYKMMNELVRNKCDVTNHQVNVQFLLQLQPEWQRFVALNEVNELRDERLVRTANPLALVAQQQPAYHPQNHHTHYTNNSSTRSQQAATRNRGKAIVNSPSPTYDQEPKMVAEDDSIHKEKILLCKQEEAGFQLNAEHADWRDDTDDEPDDQELEAHYLYMAQIQEVTSDAADILDLSLMLSYFKRTKMPMVVPISTREPKRIVNQSVAIPIKRTIASKSTNQKSRSTIRKLYEQVSKTCSWWYHKFTPSGYKWKPMSPIGNVNTNVSMPLGNASRTANILELVTPRCSKHMTRNLKLLSNFVEQFLGTVKFGNDQIAPILRYGDLVQGNVTIKRVYYVEGLNHNLFSIGQFCDADLEVAFRKYTCYIRDLKGNDLLIGSRGTDLYYVNLQDTSTPNPICLMAKAK